MINNDRGIKNGFFGLMLIFSTAFVFAADKNATESKLTLDEFMPKTGTLVDMNGRPVSHGVFHDMRMVGFYFVTNSLATSRFNKTAWSVRNAPHLIMNKRCIELVLVSLDKNHCSSRPINLRRKRAYMRAHDLNFPTIDMTYEDAWKLFLSTGKRSAPNLTMFSFVTKKLITTNGVAETSCPAGTKRFLSIHKNWDPEYWLAGQHLLDDYPPFAKPPLRIIARPR